MSKIMSLIKKVDWANIPKSVYIRYILMILTVINTLLTHFGVNPISASAEEIYQVASDIITLIVLVVNTWKDNPVTVAALTANKYMKDLKSGTVTETTDTESVG